MICPICGALQDIGNTFTQAQRQKVKRQNACYVEDKLKIRIYEVPADHKAKGPHARCDKERDSQRGRKGIKWARNTEREGYATLMDKWLAEPG